jgi:ADP-heptose:LPS heptosyltransferase
MTNSMTDKLSLPDVTLVSISCVKYGETIKALEKSLSQITPARTILFTDADVIVHGIEVIKIDTLDWEGYSRFVMKELYHHIETSHVLIVQHDSWVLNADCWSDEFLKYDMIGARWLYNDGRANGNGGFCLKSQMLLHYTATLDEIEILHPEDECIGRLYRRLLESKGIVFAPDHICDKFSFELRHPTQRTFGFHGFHHEPFKEHIVIHRTGALGDVIMLEPLMEYYHNKGYQVVLDTQPHYMGVFFQHPFPILHISQMQKGIVPFKYLEMDMAYERTPKQLALKSYYEAAGIEDGEIRNSQLYFGLSEENRMMDNYVIIHNDDTGIPHRNIYDVKWTRVVSYLEEKGFTVFQVGKNSHETAGKFFNTPSNQMLMFLMAGASMFIGGDSGVAQVAVGLGIPSIILSGSVNLKYRYADFQNIKVVQNKCEFQHCYHEEVGVRGVDCRINKNAPPCTSFSHSQIIEKIKQLQHDDQK